MFLIFGSLPVFGCQVRPEKITGLSGPLGSLYAELTLSKGFDTSKDSCDLVILMHGFWVDHNCPPIPRLGRWFLRHGFAVLTLDFQGCGKSDGLSTDMTVNGEVKDAYSVYSYARTLPYVRSITLAGHSQGGLVAGLLAGRLASAGERTPDALVLLAAASAIRDFAVQGRVLSVTCDPADPPESIDIYGYRIGKGYILEAQQLDVYGDTSPYQGPTCIVHGTKDRIVPFSYGEEYHAAMPQSEFYPVERDCHLLSKKKELDRILAGFFQRLGMGSF